MMLFVLVLYILQVSSEDAAYCGPSMDIFTREDCLRTKIYAKIPKELIYRIMFRGNYGSSSYSILITTYYFEPGFSSNFTYLDGLVISYDSKNPGRAPGSGPCSPIRKVCEDGTVIFANQYTCVFPPCYTNPPSCFSKTCRDGTVIKASGPDCVFTKSCPSDSFLGFSWVYWVPILCVFAVILVSFLIFLIILKRYRQKQALQGLNDDVQNTTNPSGSNYFMTTTNNIASSHPVYLYQPNSAVNTNGPVPTGYVPVLQTNIQPNIPLSSDEIYARELQTKFDQGY